MSILPVRDADDLVMDWLDFWSQRRMNMVSRTYRDRMNVRFREQCRALNASTPAEMWDGFVRAGNLDACQWILAKYSDQFTINYSEMIRTENVVFIEWCLDQYNLPAQERILDITCLLDGPEHIVYLDEPVRLGNREILDLITHWFLPQELDSFHSLQKVTKMLGTGSLNGISYLDQASIEGGRPIDWSIKLKRSLHLVLQQENVKILAWLETKVSIDWNRQVNSKKLLFYSPAIWTLLREKGFCFEPHLPALLEEILDRSRRGILRGLPYFQWLSKYKYHLVPSLNQAIWAGRQGLPWIQLLSPYLSSEQISGLYLTTTARYSPYSAEVDDYLRSLKPS